MVKSDMLLDAARNLSSAVDGIDWVTEEVSRAINAIHRHGKGASAERLDGALAILVARLSRFRISDGDGLAHVAITGGTLVEFGASAAPLAEIMLQKIPVVLRASRECANVCLDDPRIPEEWPEDESEVLAEVDERPILRTVFREALAADRSRAQLAYAV